ncbi:MAG: hypothetical protein IJN27_02435 [Oscillospiraceae bacterium]|nr:hypothetical protein [Oscillospiraceae bacterium]
MKILATKKEFAEMVRKCALDGRCDNCVLDNYCCEDDTEKTLEDFVEIVETVNEKTKK